MLALVPNIPAQTTGPLFARSFVWHGPFGML